MLHFKSLQSRLFVLLMLPVFCIIFVGGTLSFVHTRDVILEQWNESAVLKLQRAAHYIEMRLLKPTEMIEILFRLSEKKGTFLSSEKIINHLKTLEGVVDVTYSNSNENIAFEHHHRMMPKTGMMNIRYTRIAKISDPVLDSNLGEKTVVLSLSLLDSDGNENGLIQVKMSFIYLLKDIIELSWWQSDMACIVDQEGNYMAHTNMGMQDRQTLGGKEDPLEQKILTRIKISPYGTVQSDGYPPEMVAGYYHLDHIPWTIILFAKGDVILKPIINYRNAFGLGSSVLIFIILFLIRHHIGTIVRQITTLSSNSKMVASGNYGESIAVASEDEIGQLTKNYNEMVKGLKERDFIRDSFGRYVDPDFAKYLLEHPDAGKLGGERREVVLMMSDLRGFTALSETLSPEIIIRLLNHYFSHMISIIQDFNGIIVDFYGDAILVFFDPLSGSARDIALCSIQCASKMQSEMTVFNKKMKEKNLPCLEMGIGINAGQVIVGNIGSETRAKYGVVGSAVNITSRIQAVAEGRSIVVSESVYQYTKDQVQIKQKFSSTLKGVDEQVTLRVIENLL